MPIAPCRRVALDSFARNARTRDIIAKRCGTDILVGAAFDLAQLIDVRKDLRHLIGHALQAGIIEFEMRELGDVLRFFRTDLHGESVHSAALANPRERPPQIVAIVLMIVIAFAAIVRMRLLDLPLERDEGEYAYAGQLLLQGVPPYSQAYTMKFPGMYVAYAAIMAVFGQTVTAIRLGLLIANAATIVLLYFLTRRLFGNIAGLMAGAAYAIFSLEPALLGLYAHATHFVNLFVVAALFLLARDRSRFEILAAGALLGIAILIKQQAAAFALFALLWTRFRRAGYLIGGAAIVGAISAAALSLSGVFPRFWLWTIRYAKEYLTSATASQGLELFMMTTRPIFYFAPLMWLMAAAGLVVLFFKKVQWQFVVGYTIAAVVAIAPGFYFREHYFIVLLPPAAILVAIAVVSGPRIIAPAAFAIAVVTSLMRMWGLLFALDGNAITKYVFPSNPFLETVEVANYLKDHTEENDRIAVLGSEPEIFFYARRKSATGYIYTYPLMEKQRFAHQMQEEMIAEIERAKPKYLVMVDNAPSWLRRPDSDMTIFNWEQSEVQRAWTLEGIADILPNGTAYAWGADAQRYRAQTRNVILVYRRTSS